MMLYRSYADSKRATSSLLSGKPMRFVHKQVDGALGSRPNIAGGESLVYVNTDRHVADLSSNTVWAIEKRSSPLDGSACDWGEFFRLRHVGSGMLLMVALADKSPGRSRGIGAANRQQVANVLLTNEANDDTLFALEPQYPSEGAISLDSFFRIKHVNTNFYIHVEMQATASSAPFGCCVRVESCLAIGAGRRR